MKKTIVLLILMLFPTSGLLIYGQTDSIEKAIIFMKVQNKEIKESDFIILGAKWNQTMKKFGKYPDLQFDLSGTVHYSYVKEFSGVNKQKLFSHILEWQSINYGIFPSNLYSSLDDGKIVIRNSYDLSRGKSLTYTSVISIKNEKILIEYINLGYQIYSEGYYSNEMWIPERTVNFGINQIFPIILKDSDEWILNLNLLKKTNEYFNTDSENLSRFIVAYDSYNNF